MGIFSFLFGGCDRQPQQQQPQPRAKQQPQQHHPAIALTKSPEITSESEEGFHDLIFYIQEHKKQANGAQTLRGSGTHKGRQLALDVILGATWEAASLGKDIPPCDLSRHGHVSLHWSRERRVPSSAG